MERVSGENDTKVSFADVVSVDESKDALNERTQGQRADTGSVSGHRVSA